MKIGIDIGGSHIGVALIGVGGQIKASKEVECVTKEIGKKGLQTYMLETLNTLLEENEIRKSSITKIGVAMPGVIEGKQAKQLWNLQEEEFSIAFLQAAYPQVHILLKNDADAAALAEKRYGALEPYENALFLCLGTGIGGGYIYQGNIAFANHFEPGHMCIQKGGKLCSCGAKGCWETYASMKQFKQNAIDAMQLPKQTSSQELLEILEKTKENPLVETMVEQYTENLAIGIGNLCNVLAPEAICLGGSFAYYATILLPTLEKKLQQGSYIFNKAHIPVLLTAQLQNQAGMLGAVL